MSIKRKLIAAYIGLVIIPMGILVIVITLMTSPYLTSINLSMEGVERRLTESSFLPVLKTLQEDQVKEPSIILDSDYLKKIIDRHQDLIGIQVKESGKIIMDVSRNLESVEVDQNKLQKSQLTFRNQDRLYDVSLTYRPYVLEINGDDFKKIMESRLRLGVISYMVLHLIFVLFLTKYFLKPINELKLVADKVGRKEYDFELDTQRKDEIGETFVAFDNMRNAIQSYESNRKELVANISHDLKTPITAIKGYIGALQDGLANSPEKQNKYLEIMSNNVQHLDRLVDDLFLHSKLDVDQVDFEFQTIAFEKYMDYLIDDIRIESEAKGIVLKWDDGNLSDVMCRIDSFKIRRAIFNLVDNSVKHFNKEEKILSIALKQTEDQAVLTIWDNGKGIPAQDIDHVFDRFFRADNSRNTAIGGSGLGLAITKQILEKHDAQIMITSQLNVYTCVEIRFPLV